MKGLKKWHNMFALHRHAVCTRASLLDVCNIYTRSSSLAPQIRCCIRAPKAERVGSALRHICSVCLILSQLSEC